MDTLLGIQNVENDLSIAYARVSGHDQKKDLENQAALWASFCMAHGWNYEFIQDLGSGMNYHKKGLKHLFGMIFGKKNSPPCYHT